MKITFVQILDRSGGCRVTVEYAERLIQMGHSVTMVSPVQPPVPRIRRIKNWLRGRPAPSPVAGSFADDRHVPVVMLDTYRPVTANDVPDADVVIATWWETATWVAGFPESKGVQFQLVQDFETWQGREDEVVESLRLPLHKITISQWLRNILTDEIGASVCATIENGVNASEFFPDRSVPADANQFGFVHTSELRKGGDIAVAAVELAKGVQPQIKALAFGHRDPVPPILLPDHVAFHRAPSQAEIRKLYGQCRAWIFASRHEGFGLPILEAMACGTPVIATPAGAAPELVTRGGGVLVERADPELLSAEILRFASMPEDEWQERSRLALAVAAEHNWEDAAAEFEATLIRYASK